MKHYGRTDNTLGFAVLSTALHVIAAMVIAGGYFAYAAPVHHERIVRLDVVRLGNTGGSSGISGEGGTAEKPKPPSRTILPVKQAAAGAVHPAQVDLSVSEPTPVRNMTFTPVTHTLLASALHIFKDTQNGQQVDTGKDTGSHAAAESSDAQPFGSIGQSGGGPSGSPTSAGDGAGVAGHGGLSAFGANGGPTVVRFVAPSYPTRAARLRVEGRVVLRLVLDDEGNVKSAHVEEPAGYGFDEAALESVDRSVFGPAIVDGSPVGCTALLPVRFELADRRR